jgi:hypothetical protein
MDGLLAERIAHPEMELYFCSASVGRMVSGISAPQGLVSDDGRAPRAQFEISIDGKPRSHRDRKDIAIEAAEFLKRKFPNSVVAVKDLQSGELTAIDYKSGLRLF